MSRRLRAVDLFAGCGGLSLGLERAGFDVVAAIDSDELASETYKKNHPNAFFVHGDITKVSASKLMRKLGLRKGELALLAGCPPCQGFSTIRTLNGQRRLREPMNDLVFQFLRFVRVMRPQAIMMENVPGLAKNDRLTKFCKVLSGLGYYWEYKVLDAANYGVAQRRKRMILLASRYKQPTFASQSSVRKTVRNVISTLAKAGASGDALHDHPAKRSPHVEILIRRIPLNGGSRSALPRRDQLPCHRRSNGFKDIYGRMAWDAPAPTITGGCVNPSKGRYLHPRHHRAITLREAALLQGFPRRYYFSLKNGVYPAAQMIGNAFPPAFATRHARKLAALIK